VRVAPSAIRPGLPPAVDEIVMRALEADRERRWPSAEAFAAALGATVAAASAWPGHPGPAAAGPGSSDATRGDPALGRLDDDHTVADPTSVDRSSMGPGVRPDDRTMRVPPYEQTMQQHRPRPDGPAAATVVDLPLGDLPDQGGRASRGAHREVRSGDTFRSRFLVALSLIAVLAVGGGGAYAIAKATGSSSSDKAGDGLVGVTDTTGRLSLRVPPAWKLQTQHNKWPVPVSDAATAPALRATPDYAQFVRDDVAVPGVFAGLTHDQAVRLPPATLGDHQAKCTRGTDRPYRHGSLSGQITPWTCGSITINEVGLRDSAGFAMWVRVKLTGAPDLTQRILDSIRTKG
jgi:hypothetical protein